MKEEKHDFLHVRSPDPAYEARNDHVACGCESKLENIDRKSREVVIV